MSSEARLYAFSQETKDKLRKFRLGTSRAKDAQAVIFNDEPGGDGRLTVGRRLKQDQIDKKTFEISQADDNVYTDMDAVAEELPDHNPRYILLSYPLTMASGRLSVPYVMLFYMPTTCTSESRMLYAGAKELMRNTAEASRIIDVADADDLCEIEEKLKGED